MTDTIRCFHCGTAIDGPAPHQLQIDGTPVALCSNACQEIATRIRDKGLTVLCFRTDAATCRHQREPERWASLTGKPCKKFVSSQRRRPGSQLLPVHRLFWLIERGCSARRTRK
jgi:hypothetical protein